MPTLNAGQSVTLTVTQPNGWVTVTCAGNDEMSLSWVGPGSVSGMRTVKNIAEDVGPFVDGTVVTLRAVSGAPQYQGSLSANQGASLVSSLPNDGSVFALMEATAYVQLTVSGVAFTGACEYAGFEVVSGSGTITIYDNTAASGTVIVPATAVSVGKQERTWKLALNLGCYVVISGTLTINVFVG